MVEPDGTARLIDFGASAEVNESAATSAAVIKHFYVPEEQYDSNRRRQGAWTDVYALSATIFRALECGNLPDALERLRGEPFDGFTVPVSTPVKAAVIHGLALFQKDRAQNVEELLEAFSGASEGTSVYKKPKTPKTAVHTPEAKKIPTKQFVAVLGGIAAIAAVCLIIFLPRESVPTGGELLTETTIVTDMSGNVQTADEAVAVTGAVTANGATANGATATATAETTTARTTTAPTVTTTAATTAPETYVENRSYFANFAGGDYAGQYTGEWNNGKPEGKGVITSSRVSYDGEWKNGVPSGEGKLIRYEHWEREYTGGFLNGLFDGYGVLVNQDGYTYEGEFKNGAKNGKGSEFDYVTADDDYAREGKNWIFTGEYVNHSYLPNSEFERLIYEKDGGVRTEYCTVAPTGDHMLGDWQEDPMTIRHNKRINTDGSIDEWDSVIIGGQYTAVINNTHTDPLQ
jgi:hypothetical protein